MTPYAEYHANLVPTLAPSRPAVEIARHACRALCRSRLEIVPVCQSIDEMPVEDRPDGLIAAFCDAIYRPARSCLSALLALLPDAPSDGRMTNRGSFGVELDGRLFLAVWDEDGTIYKESEMVSDGGCYRLFDVARSAVLDLTPREAVEEPQPAIEAAPPWSDFAAGGLGWRVSYHGDLLEAMRGSKGRDVQVMPAGPAPSPGRMCGAFVFSRLNEHPGELYSLTR